MKRLFLGLMIVFTAYGSTEAAVFEVTLSGTSFTPNSVSIFVGDTIRWRNVNGIHTTTSGTGAGDPQAGVLWDEPLSGVQTYERQFTMAGTFPYFCRPHEVFGMTAVISVSERPASLTDISAVTPLFTPDSVNILIGNAVRWIRVEGSHTTTSGEGAADPQAGVLWDQVLDLTNPSFMRTFSTTGVFPYFCRPHELSGMDGVVVVTDTSDCACDCQADVACDSVANVFDVVFAVAEAFRSAPPSIDPNPACPLGSDNDVNFSGDVNVFDVVFIVNMAFRSGARVDNICDPCTGEGPCAAR